MNILVITDWGCGLQYPSVIDSPELPHPTVSPPVLGQYVQIVQSCKVATHPNGGERDSDAILRDETRRRRRGRKVEVDIEEKVSDRANYRNPLPSIYRTLTNLSTIALTQPTVTLSPFAGKLARVGLPPDPWRDFKIQSLKLFTEIVSWI